MVDESDQLTGLLDYWEVQGQEGQAKEAGAGGTEPPAASRPEGTGKQSEEQEGDKAVPSDVSRLEPEAGETAGKEKEKCGPAVPPKGAASLPPPRPTSGHTAQPPSDAHIQLAEEAYTEYGLFEATRMKAYSHLRMPLPLVEVMPARTLRSSEVLYEVKISAPAASSATGDMYKSSTESTWSSIRWFPLSVSMARQSGTSLWTRGLTSPSFSYPRS